MSFGRVLTSGCQPLVRGGLSVSVAAASVASPSLRSSVYSKQHYLRPFLQSQRSAGALQSSRSLKCHTKLYRRIKTRVPSRVASSLVEQVQEKNKKFPVLVYSKTWCPYCAQVKGLFSQLKVEYTAIELDDVVEGDAVQDALEDLTHRRTVPQVFINGEFIGGCDDTLDAYNSGSLNEKLAAAGFPVEG